MQTSKLLAEQLKALTVLDTKNKILAKGLARGVVWKEGVVPEGAPAYGKHLTQNLLHYGYAVLVKAIYLYDSGEERELAMNSLRFAAECIESAVRKGERTTERGFDLLVASCAFHLGGYAARSFCLLVESRLSLNLSTSESFLLLLIRKELGKLKLACFDWLNTPENSDETLAHSIEQLKSSDLLQLFVTAATRNYIRALSYFDYALTSGNEVFFEKAKTLITAGLKECADPDISHVPLWWCYRLTLSLLNDIWSTSLHKLLPISTLGEDFAWNDLRKKFIALQLSNNFAETCLWPSQLEAAERIMDTEDDLVLSLPTSAGKTKIAELCILRALSKGQRAIYVTPLRALSAQIERRLSRIFRPMGYSVSSLYGSSGVTYMDVNTLRETSITVSTPEKLDFALRQDPDLLNDVGVIVLDEGHMIGLGSREVRYEVLVQRLLRRSDSGNRRLVCLSAVFSSNESFQDFTDWLREDSEGEAILSTWRPTRQRLAKVDWLDEGKLSFYEDADFSQAFIPKYITAAVSSKATTRTLDCPANQAELTILTALRLAEDKHKVLIYCPLKASVETIGKVFLTMHRQGFISALTTDMASLAKARAVGKEWLGESHIALKCLDLGLALHHGSLPRQFLAEIELLLERKAIQIVIASPTMAQGVDLTCSAVVFHSIYSFGDPMKSSDYSNVIGRVGRAFVDLDGLIIFPIFKRSRKLFRDLNQLLTSSERKLESGLFQLIDKLINMIKENLKTNDLNFEEYVLNGRSSWQFEKNADEIQKLLDSLDTAILGTCDALEVPTTDLADLLDSALKSSLWQRTLKRTPQILSQEQTFLLRCRAQWIWSRTSPSERKGLFAAGVGLSAGTAIKNHFKELTSSLIRADLFLNMSDTLGFVEEILKIAVILFEEHPFKRKDRTIHWQQVLQLWLSGASLDSLNGDTALIACIQEDFVFRLVWAVEAIRAYAREIGFSDTNYLSGAVPLCITYGVPSQFAAMLIQSGLSSRIVAQVLTKQKPAIISNMSEIIDWVNSIDNVPFSAASDENTIWEAFKSDLRSNDFASPWQKRWHLSVSESDIRLISKEKSTLVCSVDMEELGSFEFDSRNLAVYDIVKSEKDDNVIVSTLRIR